MAYGDNEMENGVIESTLLGIEDHNILYLSVHIKFDGSEQGYLVTLGTENAYIAMRSVLEALEVNFWEQLPGHACRVRRNKSLIESIGHIYKDKWSVRVEE